MKKYDVMIIGAGSGLDIVAFAEERGFSVALLEEGPLGGTCHNRGCIPSKMLIHGADVAETIRSSHKFGIKANIESIDFGGFVQEVNDLLEKEARQMEEGISQSKLAHLYKVRGKFIDQKVLQVGSETITADKIFIVGGARAAIPPIPGLDKVKYLTSTEALKLTTQPKHLVVIGGGYVACELAHFYGAMGTKVTLLVRGTGLLTNEDEEISKRFTKEFAKKYQVRFETEAQSVSQAGDSIKIKLKDLPAGRQGETISCDQLLVATGRIPNSDILAVKATGVALNDQGYIKVNEYLETNVVGIWALGDIVGIEPFKHTANHQATYAIRNGLLGKKEAVDYSAIGHAVFSSPQVASVGKTEQQLKKEGVHYQVGREEYSQTGMGAALKEEGLVKVLVDEGGHILGGHIIGPDASILIHEIIVAMKTTGTVSAITNSVYIHPALSEVVQRAFYSIE